MRNKKWISLIITLTLMCTMVCGGFVTAAAGANGFKDTGAHWAKADIDEMVAKGIVQGYSADNTFRPDNTITRAEFVTLVNRAFQFTTPATTQFTDVAPADWYAQQVSCAVAAGYIQGFGDGTFKPQNLITRQEVFTMIARVLKLDLSSDNTILQRFQDGAQIPEWSRGAIIALLEKGLITAYPDNTLRFAQNMTRGESVVFLKRSMAAEPGVTPLKDSRVFDAAGFFDGQNAVIDGNVTVTARDVSLKNWIINGDLIIDSSVGNGTVSLRNVQVKGTIYVRGGSIIEMNGNAPSVKVESKDTTFKLFSGTIDLFEAAAPASGCTLYVASGATVKKVILNSLTRLTGSGLIVLAQVNADGSTRSPNINIQTVQYAPGVTELKISTAGGGGGGGGGPSSSESAEKTAARDSLVSLYKAIAGVTYSSDVATFQQNLQDFENQQLDTLQELVGSKVKMGDFFDLALAVKAELLDIMSGNKSTLVGLKNASDKEIQEQIIAWTIDAIDNVCARPEYSWFKGAINDLGLTVDKIAEQQVVLADLADPEMEARTALVLGYIRANTLLTGGSCGLDKGASTTYTLTILNKNPDGKANELFDWHSSTDSVARFDSVYNPLTAGDSAGSTTITARRMNSSDSLDYVLKFKVGVDQSAPKIETTRLYDALAGEAYKLQLHAYGGDGTYAWSVSSGALPPGMSLSDGILSGLPTSAGTYDFTIKVSSNSIDATQAYRLTVNPNTGQRDKLAYKLGQASYFLEQPEKDNIQAAQVKTMSLTSTQWETVIDPLLTTEVIKRLNSKP